jgi:hypothetical protein
VRLEDAEDTRGIDKEVVVDVESRVVEEIDEDEEGVLSEVVCCEEEMIKEEREAEEEEWMEVDKED